MPNRSEIHIGDLDGAVALALQNGAAPPHTVDVQTHVAPELSDRVLDIAKVLLDAFRPIIARVGGPSPRPATLARVLKIDATLSGRLIRALRPRNVADVIHELPSPEGFRIVLSAALRHDISPEMRDQAARAIREFELLLDDLPGGRATLDTIAAEWSPATRERAENSARQAIYKSMSSLLGVVTDVTFETVVVQPSEDPSWVDAAYIVGKIGLRRLRTGGPLTAFGRMSDAANTNRLDRPMTLGGKYSDNAKDYLLEEFSTRPVPPLQSVRNAQYDLMLLPPATPALNIPVSLVFSQFLRHSGRNPRRAGDEPFWEKHLPRMPSRDFVFDLLIREDTFSRPPTLTAGLHGFSSGGATPGSADFRRDEVAITTNMETMRRGLGDVDCAEIPDYERLVDFAFDSLGWDKSKFVGYRCRMRYPVPLVELGFWIPGGDADSSPRPMSSPLNGLARSQTRGATP
jgi:hypothetical protein